MDKLDAMRTFVAVVQEGSFSKAAVKLAISPQLVSKYVAQLEQQLKTRLLNRTTRRVNVTEAGRAYFERSKQLLIDIEEMENALSNLQSQASGLLRVSAPMAFGNQHLSDAIVEFQQRYPDVEIDLTLTDKKVDIVDSSVDVALRIGKLASSSLVAKKLAPVKLVVCASGEYLKNNGIPKTPSDLTRHNYLHYTYADAEAIFSCFDDTFSAQMLNSDFTCNNGEFVVKAAIRGRGIAIQPTFLVGKALAEGRLQVILEDYQPEPMGLYAVYAHRQYLASKVRCFIEFLTEYYGPAPYWDNY